MKTRYPLILLLNIAGLALFLSWYLPHGHGLWFSLDSGIFHFFNHKLVESPLFLWIVAVTNNRAFDGCSLLAMGTLMLSFWLKETQEGRRRIVAIGLVMLLTAVILNQLGQALIPVKRASPTLTFDNINRVSELLHISTKDASRDSFPGDHGMMLLIFSAFMLRYFGKVAGIIGLIITVVFAFPRVMIGALAYRYRGRFYDRRIDWLALVVNDAIKRPSGYAVYSLSPRQKQTIFKQITQSN